MREALKLPDCASKSRAPATNKVIPLRDAGYAAVDAMVAMLMIALVLGLSLRAIEQSERAAQLAQEVGLADTLLNALMDGDSQSLGTSTGVTGRFTWSLQVSPAGADRPIELCRRAAQLRSQVSSRLYSASSLVTCPAAEGVG